MQGAHGLAAISPYQVRKSFEDDFRLAVNKLDGIAQPVRQVGCMLCQRGSCGCLRPGAASPLHVPASMHGECRTRTNIWA